MKRKLIPGNWYRIRCTTGVSYNGIAMFIRSDPKNYPAGTFQFLCSDGVDGVFTADEIVRKIPTPKPEKLVECLMKVANRN